MSDSDIRDEAISVLTRLAPDTAVAGVEDMDDEHVGILRPAGIRALLLAGQIEPLDALHLALAAEQPPVTAS